MKCSLEGTLGGEAGAAGVVVGGGRGLLDEEEGALSHGVREGEVFRLGDAGAQLGEGAVAFCDFVGGLGAFHGEAVAADAGEGEGVFEGDGEGGDGAAEDEVVGVAVVGVAAGGFGALSQDGRVTEVEGRDGCLEEGGALLVGFDEGVRGLRTGDGEDEAGEAAAGADVGDGLAGGDVADQEAGEGVEEVLDGNFGGVGDGGEAGFGLPVEEKGVVGGEGLEVLGREVQAEVGGAGGEGRAELDEALHLDGEYDGGREGTCGETAGGTHSLCSGQAPRSSPRTPLTRS